MSGVTVDASVWVAAAELSDLNSGQSRAFLAGLIERRTRINVPAFARIEVACALARRRRDPHLARRLTDAMLTPERVIHMPVNAALLTQALLLGTGAFLRGADTLYAATAQLSDSQLISWDNELVQRAGALTPSIWLVNNP